MVSFNISILSILLSTLLFASTFAKGTNSNKDVQTVQYQNGTQHITYYTQGPPDGPALIFLHGWPAVAETWKYQVDHFASLGYYTVTPDMPGYGESSHNDDFGDYAHESIIPGLLAMLESTGRTKAIWIGHDWGAAVASSLVATHPEVVEAMAWLAVPYKTVELGYIEMLPLVNRTIYPVEEYPYGQWDYMVYYEESFDRATAVFDSNISYSAKALYGPWDGNTSIIYYPGFLSHIRRDGGWFGGINQAPSGDTILLNATVLDQDLYEVLVRKMSSTGFYPADAYYMNHARNLAYNLENQKNNGYLDIPCLFIEAKYDTTCATATSDLLDPMITHCKDLTFASVDTAHWVQLERPEEVNTAITSWLLQNVTASSCDHK